MAVPLRSLARARDALRFVSRAAFCVADLIYFQCGMAAARTGRQARFHRPGVSGDRSTRSSSAARPVHHPGGLRMASAGLDLYLVVPSPVVVESPPRMVVRDRVPGGLAGRL